MFAKMYIQIQMMHFSKINYSYGEQRGAICARQATTTTPWHNKHPIKEMWVTKRLDIGPPCKPTMVL
jgi:hypothetical protein